MCEARHSCTEIAVEVSVYFKLAVMRPNSSIIKQCSNRKQNIKVYKDNFRVLLVPVFCLCVLYIYYTGVTKLSTLLRNGRLSEHLLISCHRSAADGK